MPPILKPDMKCLVWFVAGYFLIPMVLKVAKR
jgi:hypothetical protein